MAGENKKNVQTYIYLGISIIIFLICYFLIYPLVLNIREQKKEILITEETLEQKKATIERFNKIVKKYNGLSSEVEKIDKVIPSEINLPKLLFQFETLAKDSGMILESISFGNLEERGGNISIVPVNLRLIGTYKSFKNYLETTARNIPLIDVGAISFTTGKEKTYVFSLKVNTYIKKEISETEPPEEESEEEETPKEE